MDPVIHFEMYSSNLPATQEFFQQLFGWKIAKWQGPWDYFLITTSQEGASGIGGGLMSSPDGKPMTINSIQVEDLDHMLEKVAIAGGKTILPKTSIPGVGSIAYCSDPTGIIFGLVQYTQEKKGKHS